MNIQVSTVVNDSADVIFTYLTETEKLKLWQTFLVESESLSNGTIGVGSKFRNVMSHPGFDTSGIVTLELIGEVLVFEPNKQLKIRGESNIANLIIDYRLYQVDDKTTIQQTADFELQGFLLRSISNLMNGFLVDQFQADLTKLKLLVEAQQKSK